MWSDRRRIRQNSIKNSISINF